MHTVKRTSFHVLYMHSFQELGDRLRPQRNTGERLMTVLKRELKREILRMRYTPARHRWDQDIQSACAFRDASNRLSRKNQPLSHSDVILPGSIARATPSLPRSFADARKGAGAAQDGRTDHRRMDGHLRNPRKGPPEERGERPQ